MIRHWSCCVLKKCQFSGFVSCKPGTSTRDIRSVKSRGHMTLQVRVDLASVMLQGHIQKRIPVVEVAETLSNDLELFAASQFGKHRGKWFFTLQVSPLTAVKHNCLVSRAAVSF